MVEVDEERCLGCGACVSVCPKGFEMIGGKSVVKDANSSCIEDAISACPVGAISR